MHEGEVSVAEAAKRLGRSQSTIRNWLAAGTLRGTRGTQPQRPRWSVIVDANGAPLTPRGPHPAFSAPHTSCEAELASLRERIEALEHARDRSSELGRAQEIGALLRTTLDHQQRAAHRQAEAIEELGEALRIQSELLTQLLLSGSPARGGI